MSSKNEPGKNQTRVTNNRKSIMGNRTIKRSRFAVSSPLYSTTPVNLNRNTSPIFMNTLNGFNINVNNDDTIESDNDENECAVDARLDACKRNDAREEVLLSCLRGVEVSDALINASFTCGSVKIRNLVANLTAKYPLLAGSILRIGGQANNYDYTFNTGSKLANIELKTSKSNIDFKYLEAKPWHGYGQFLQIFINVKDPKYIPFFESFGISSMMRAWYDTVILPILMVKYNIVGPIDYESYLRLAFKSSKVAAEIYTKDTTIPSGTKALFEYFHQHKSPADNLYRGNLWKSFCKSWMETHRFGDRESTDIISKILEKKDIWICTTKTNAYVIDGPICESIVFNQLKQGKTAMVLEYTATMRNASMTYTIPILMRLYWKNGGQGVHNLCLQIS